MGRILIKKTYKKNRKKTNFLIYKYKIWKNQNIKKFVFQGVFFGFKSS